MNTIQTVTVKLTADQLSKTLKRRNAFPGDRVYILTRGVATTAAILQAGDAVIPLSGGLNNVNGFYEVTWRLVG